MGHGDRFIVPIRTQKHRDRYFVLKYCNRKNKVPVPMFLPLVVITNINY
jgi:hypothetical protein